MVARVDGTVEVYVPPDKGPLNQDAWWAQHYLKPGSGEGSVSYRTHVCGADTSLRCIAVTPWPRRG